MFDELLKQRMYNRFVRHTNEQLRGERNQNKDEGRRDEEKREIGRPGARIALQSLLLGPSRELDKHSMHLARFSLKARLPLLPCHLFGPGPLSSVYRVSFR